MKASIMLLCVDDLSVSPSNAVHDPARLSCACSTLVPMSLHVVWKALKNWRIRVTETDEEWEGNSHTS